MSYKSDQDKFRKEFRELARLNQDNGIDMDKGSVAYDALYHSLRRKYLDASNAKSRLATVKRNLSK